MLPSLLSDPSPNCMLQARTCVFVSIFRASIGGDAFTDPHFSFQEPLIGEDWDDLLHLLHIIVIVNKDEVFTKEDIIAKVIMIEMKTQICFTEMRYSSNSNPNPTQLKTSLDIGEEFFTVTSRSIDTKLNWRRWTRRGKISS